MKQAGNTIRISFLGDLMCTTPMTQKAKSASGFDYTPVFENIKKSLASSDYVVGNLETPLAGEDCLYSFHPTEFNTPDEFVSAAYDAGINMMTTANNHSLDRGLYGLKRTISILDQHGVEHVGTQLEMDSERTLYKMIGGIRFAFISYTYDTNSKWMNNKLPEEQLYHINLFKEQDSFPYGGEGFKASGVKHTIHSLVPDFVKDILRDKSKLDCGTLQDFSSLKNKHFEDQLFNDINRAKAESDYVFVCLHIGGQYNDEIGVYTQKVVEKCKQVGASYVICNHPHCVLPITIDKDGTLVAYALGNFCYTPKWGYYVDGKFSEYSVIIHLDFQNNTKRLSDVRFSILRSVENRINTQVFNIFDLYNSKSDRQKRIINNEIKGVLNRLLKVHVANVDIKDEYSVNDFI